jgi:hypothetical protein
LLRGIVLFLPERITADAPLRKINKSAFETAAQQSEAWQYLYADFVVMIQKTLCFW